MGYKQRLLRKISGRDAQVAVVGLGYVGLPLAVEFAESGFCVIGMDVDAEKVQQINAGESYIDDVAGERVRDLVEAGKLSATGCYSDLRQVDAISICVPTPLRKTRDPDMSHIIQAAQSIAEIRHPGMLIVLESTTYPGTTEEIILPTIVGDAISLSATIYSSPSRPSESIPATQAFPCAIRPRWSAASPRIAPRSPKPFMKRRLIRSSPYLRPRRRRWSNCSRIHFARSISVS